MMQATWIMLAGLTLGAPLSEREILDQADARINRHRTGQATLKLIGPDGKPISSGASIRIEQTNHAFLFGSNIFKLGKCRTPADNAAYEKHFAELLNFATAPFYWWSYERVRDEPDHAGTDKILAWCKKNGIKTKGHPLAWNWGDPRWLAEDAERAMKLQLGRIDRDVRRFKGRLDIWDVVNEATHYDRPGPKDRAPILTAAINEMGIGEYVRSAFRAARKANPDAVLLINDYRTDTDYADKVVKELVGADGKPMYDVIGIQSHQHGGAWPVAKIWDACERFAKFGKPLHFTETTFVSGEPGWDLAKRRRNDPKFKWKSTPEGEKRQTEQVVRFYTVLFSHPAVEAITWWDFSDQGAWQGAPSGFLRADMTPKPAYHALKKLVKGKWWTRTEVAVGSEGRAGFRGYFGDYRVTITGDESLTGIFRFDKTSASVIEVDVK